ncbi:hypothetical protein QYF61_021338 [Mycteria americana]|uniref:Uncharacterized protein n=1 Tax=Mycteria americana TaxID=33587 RepID=A0AAN7MIP6_MYCAM|nr:hypothetical protein QYF61_021338 [Mycteria americana]
MRGLTAGGTIEYRPATTRFRDGEDMEGGFRQANKAVIKNRETTARGDLQHCPEDVHIGQHNENKTHKYHKDTNHNNPNFAEGIGHGFGDSGGNGGQVEEREVEEEEVHGAVEVMVADYSGDDETVAQEGSQVDAQEEPEVQELQLPCVHECQEKELGDGAAIGRLLPPGMGTRAKRKSCIAHSLTDERKAGTLVPMDTPAQKDPQDQCVTLQLKLPSPESLTARTG